MHALTAPTGRFQILTALFLVVAMIATVGSALGFEHIGGYMPCLLCLEQRTPYYAGIPVMALAFVSASLKWPGVVTRGLLAAGGLLMVYGLALAVYHAGVEWQFWEGPADCAAAATSITTDVGSLLNDLNTVRPPSCSEAALRVLGLSFAGWNVIASLILAAVAFRGAFRKAGA